MEHKKELIRDMEQEFSRDSNKKLITAGLILIFSVIIISTQVDLSNSSVPNTYASPNQSGVHSVSGTVDKSFKITNSGLSPASNTIKIGGKLRFDNNLSENVSLGFDSSNKTVRIGPGNEETLAFNSITYVTVKSKRGYESQGRINVQ